MSTEPDGFEAIAKMKELERLGHEILMVKKSLVELDRARHKTREAWRAVRKQKDAGEDGQKKIPLFISPKMFVRVPIDEAEQRLKKANDEGDEDLEKTRKELKERVDDLRKFEGQQTLKEIGFDLKPVTSRFFVDQDEL
uniref:P53 and DNA damage-regulated protein 1 n=1 Tax=Panagrolaimus sp. JU765 TaxID=591449 RepID=A0AC34RT40_9BILA